MIYKWLKNRRVNWDYVDRKIVSSIDEFNKELVGLKQIKPIKENGRYTNKFLGTTDAREKIAKIWYYANIQDSYFVLPQGNTEILAFVCKNAICYKVVYRVIDINDDGDGDTVTGTKAFNFVNNLYRQYKSDIYDDYGCSDELKFLIKNCVPSPINYVNPKFKYEMLLGRCTKADVSSAYPFEATKSLPTLNDCLIFNNIEVAPSEEYPFAFYPKSGTLAIYNELDTHDFINRPEYERNNYKPNLINDDMTILCKACDKTYLADIYKKLYLQRNEIPHCKSYMNNSLGYMEMNKNPLLAHIKAVVVARCNTRVLAISDKLTERNIPTLLIATDSVSWIGPNQPDIVDVIKNEDKYLGAFALEFENCSMNICGAKSYQYITKDGKHHTKWSGKPKSYTDKLKFGDMFNILESQGFNDYVTVVKWDYDKEILVEGVKSK